MVVQGGSHWTARFPRVIIFEYSILILTSRNFLTRAKMRNRNETFTAFQHPNQIPVGTRPVNLLLRTVETEYWALPALRKNGMKYSSKY